MLDESSVPVPGIFPALAFPALHFHLHFKLAPVVLETRFIEFLPQKKQPKNAQRPNQYECSYGWDGKFIVAHDALSLPGQLCSDFVIGWRLLAGSTRAIGHDAFFKHRANPPWPDEPILWTSEVHYAPNGPAFLFAPGALYKPHCGAAPAQSGKLGRLKYIHARTSAWRLQCTCRLTGKTKMPPLIIKPAMPVSLMELLATKKSKLRLLRG